MQYSLHGEDMGKALVLSITIQSHIVFLYILVFINVTPNYFMCWRLPILRDVISIITTIITIIVVIITIITVTIFIIITITCCCCRTN